jgi:hypothetical protein
MVGPPITLDLSSFSFGTPAAMPGNTSDKTGPGFGGSGGTVGVSGIASASSDASVTAAARSAMGASVTVSPAVSHGLHQSFSVCLRQVNSISIGVILGLLLIAYSMPDRCHGMRHGEQRRARGTETE